ncbi:hypothetical protein ADK75_04480 [Streptomyces virginiae]|uniref:Uncharacterized protein n=1 Tax=Streptomyces virginiae TaxID=1961 RepID=A0A0L8N3K4_STRVG|nr:hypothetical protein [Streptomyces virginiae]KOG57256.1 hypothetical protein ADK75_04480 [Streptomyces virginiae]
MLTSTAPGPRTQRVAAALLLTTVVALALTGCGERRATDAAPGATVSTPSPGTSTSTGPSASASPTSPGASPYVEPGAGDGAPHHGENNGHRRAGEMSPASATEAKKEAARIEPLLKQLWEQGTWDPAGVRTALRPLGYEEGRLDVREMEPRPRGSGSVTPEGARIGLQVRDDACVTAFVQKTNYEVKTNGPFMESGCFEPPFAH